MITFTNKQRNIIANDAADMKYPSGDSDNPSWIEYKLHVENILIMYDITKLESIALIESRLDIKLSKYIKIQLINWWKQKALGWS